MHAEVNDFVVARNPDRESTLPYLLHVPVDGGLWLKAKDAWPRAARVYCHPSEAPALDEVEVVERTAVRSCVRRGAAIDLVLARGTNRRSQFVFTSFRGRPMIWWQTPKAAASARPGVRVPFARSSSSTVIFVDTRERYPYKFAGHRAALERKPLAAGDYAVANEAGVVAAVERKTIEDYATCLTDGSLAFAMAELAALPAAAVVVEGTYSALLRHEYTAPGYLADVTLRLQVRYPGVAESRKLAEDWTYRFLHAALAHHVKPELRLTTPAVPRPAEKKRRTRAKEEASSR